MVEWKKLGDICEIKGRIGFRGYTRDDQVDKGKGAISLSPGNIDNGSMNYESCTYITWDKYEESPEIIVNEGDIILCKTASVGKVARIRHLPEKATINPQLVLIKNIQSNPQYLFYVLDDKPFQSKIKGLAGIGSVPNVSQAKLSAIEIPIPSLFEQNRIVGILDTFTSAIDNLKEQIAQRRKQYEYYRDQLLDLEGKPGVEMKTIKDICSNICSGGTPSTSHKEYYEGSVSWLRTQEVDWKEIFDTEIRITEEAIANSSAKLIPENCIIVAMYGATAAKVAINKIPLTTNQACCNLEIDNGKALYKFVFHWLCKEYLNLKAMGEGSQNNINSQKVKGYPIPVPPLSEQQRIVSILDTFEASIQNLEAQLKERQKQYEYYRNKLLSFE